MTNKYQTPSFSPLYRQIKSLLMSHLSSGEWTPGMMIPSEFELASRFNVSQGTVRKAIDEMTAEHLLRRRQGKGTFVMTHNDPRSFFRFLRLVPDSKEPMQTRSIPIDCSVKQIDHEAALALQLAKNSKAIHLRRLLCCGETPVVLDNIWLSAKLFKGLDINTVRDWEDSLYSLFETRFEVRMVRAEEHLRAVAVAAEDAVHLGVDPGSPLLSVERTAFTYDDKPVEWRKGLYLTNNYHYFNKLG